MARLAVVAFPTLDEADRRWIEAIRSRHDPQARRIAAHFTLVFPADLTADEVAAEIASVASASARIAFRIGRAEAMPAASGGGGHVFLVPDDGSDAIASLQRRLHAGVLRPHLREDIAFSPHVTVAAHCEFSRCEALAQEINAERRAVRGRLERLELVDVARFVASSIACFALGPA